MSKNFLVFSREKVLSTGVVLRITSKRLNVRFLSDSVVKNSPVMQTKHESQVQSLVREDPLEEEMATYASILAWGISWTEEPGGLQSMGWQRVGHN